MFDLVVYFYLCNIGIGVGGEGDGDIGWIVGIVVWVDGL